VVETIRLESGHTLTGIVGSNPTLSAIHFTSINTAYSYLQVTSLLRRLKLLVAFAI
jgi:hypothetical protein